MPQEIDAEEADVNEAVLYIQKLIDDHFEPISREKCLPKASVYFRKNNPLIALRKSAESVWKPSKYGSLWLDFLKKHRRGTYACLSGNVG